MTPLVAVSSVVLVAANTGEWKEIAVVARLSTYSLVAASAFCTGLATLLMYVLAINTMLPLVFRFRLPVLESDSAVPTTVLVLTLPAVALPAVDMLPPVMLPVALINPPVSKLPPFTLPLTLTTAPV